MSDDSGDFFQLDDPVPGPIKRDRFDRPLLIPHAYRNRPDYNEYRKAYTRASTLSSYIENDIHITKWKMRYLARSMGINEDLAALAGLETYTTGFGMLDSKKNSASGKNLDRIIDQALDRVRISEKADYGTAVHLLTEPENEGYVPQRMEADVRSYLELCVELGFYFDQQRTEVFTANDVTGSAGTFDNLKWSAKYGWTITDKKTSSKVDGPHFAIQLASYANGKVYDPLTDEQFDLESLTDGEEVNREIGLIFWIKNGKTEVHELDLVKGWKGAQIAAEARDYNKAKNGRRVETEIADALSAKRRAASLAIGLCKSREDLRDLFAQERKVWTEQLTEAGNRRLSELEA